MTPEQRLDRVERILGYFVSEGRRWRVRSREQDEKINVLIHSQMETTEQINRLAAENAAAMGELRREQKLTQQTLRAFINSLRKGRNGKSSN